MEFSPFNPVVRLCIQGMEMEAKGNFEEALKIFLQGWKEASNDQEKFLSAYYLGRVQQIKSEKKEWLEKSLHHALKLNDASIESALPGLYSKLADCYRNSGQADKAEEYRALSEIYSNQNPSDKGPFYHGTKADLQTGDLLTPGSNSNYQSDLKMKHIYFTGLLNGAGLAAALAKGDGAERIYIVEPTGKFENDPNLTNQKFPGNPTRSYRSDEPLKVVGEVKEWEKPDPEEVQKFREKLAKGKGEIIN